MSNKALQSGIVKPLAVIQNGSSSCAATAQVVLRQALSPDQIKAKVKLSFATMARSVSSLTVQDRSELQNLKDTALESGAAALDGFDPNAAVAQEIILWTRAELDKASPGSTRYKLIWTANAAAVTYLKSYHAAAKLEAGS